MKQLQLIAFALRKRIDQLDRLVLEEKRSPELVQLYTRTRRRIVKRWRFITGPLPPQM